MNFIISIIISSIIVGVLVLIPLAGVWALDLHTLFGVVIPYLALATFFVGITARVIGWARSPVPFRIPTTGGQQWSLPWIKHSRFDNPKNTAGVVVRMIFDILLFRSLFRNTKIQFKSSGPKIGYEWEKWLWVAALAFHYSFLVVVLRHLRFFTEPIPGFVKTIEHLDGFIQSGIAPFPGFMVPVVLISGFVLLGAATFLVLRRIFVPQMAYISLPADYFPLFLITAIGLTGVLMRYLLKVDIVKVKEMTLSLFTFHPTVPEGIGVLFYIHLFLVSVLLAYFPFSKLMHLAGVFLSPTRNLSNNSRFVRHVNPWNYPVKVHTYEEYEEEFRDKMIEAGLPVDKMPEDNEADKAA
ncbi:MAG: menaquinol oxidoreductase [Deltaproteobacteria bacterium HGW-Deltaproteobacteria-15]|jgi:nitrate reductase gamma subunit|nr:MAG: menaquinol oxidoreductase [Deltaproteobacteria bacterium HGW-Deltaproteobacteria-15]